jgi:hypothetical protein
MLFNVKKQTHKDVLVYKEDLLLAHNVGLLARCVPTTRDYFLQGIRRGIPLRQRATQRKSTTSKSNNLLREQLQRLSQFF